MRFFEKLSAAMKRHNSWLCVGLDSATERMPASVNKKGNPQRDFNRRIIAGTADLVCAYKPNLAFYETEGRRDC